MSNQFLGQVWGFAQPPPASGNPLDAGAALAGYGPAPASPAVSIAGQPASPPPPIMTPPPAGPPPMSSPNEDPSRLMSVAPPPVSQGPKPVATGVEPPRPGPPPAPPAIGQAASMGGEQFPLVRTGGGVVKAHEVERRGPSLLAAQDNRNEASLATIDRTQARNSEAANYEYATALDHERQARLRQDAAVQAEAERAEEMAQRQNDFDSTTRQMAKHGTLDRDRFWASRTTGQKIAGVVEMMLAGFRGAPSLVQKRIDDDVKAQEFAYYAARDTNQAKQTAFSMAMQKYQNADAARAAARAAALDVVGAQLQQVGAKWKGTETANRADMAYAALQDERMLQIANGIQFVPAMRAGGGFIDPRTGIQYTNAEAQQFAKQLAERNAEREKQVTGIGGQLTVEGAKMQAQQAGKADEGAHQIAQQLQTAGVPAARSAAEQALAALNKDGGGIGESVGRAAIGAVPVVGDAAANKIMGADAQERERAWEAFQNQSLKTMMGNVTKDEMARTKNMFGSAHDPESRRRAVVATIKVLDEIEQNAKAGASPQAQAEFDRRREVATGGKAAAPPSGKQGW